MATAKKKTTKKKPSAKDRAALAQFKRVRAAARKAPRKAAPRKPRKRVAATVAAHPPSPRGGRPCKACAKIHSKRQHGSHAEGPAQAHSYKTRRRKKAESSEKSKRSRAFDRRVEGIRKSAAERAAGSKPKRRTAGKARKK